jgi:hypothetical protein
MQTKTASGARFPLPHLQSTNTVIHGIALALTFDKPGIVCGNVIVYDPGVNTK